MKLLLTELQRDFGERIVHIIFFAIVGVILGVGIPYIYYRFVDQKNYIEVTEPISFDRKIYHACDKATALLEWKSPFPVEITSEVTLYKIDENDKKQPFKRYPRSKRFQPATHEGTAEPLIIPFMVPCELEPGRYFWDILYSYPVRGFTRYANAPSVIITIVGDDVEIPKLQ